MRLAQRFFLRLAPGASNARVAIGFAASGSLGELFVPLPAPLRAAPAPAFSALWLTDGFTGNFVVTSVSVYVSSVSAALVDLRCDVASGLTAGRPVALASNGSGGYLDLAAEL